MYLKSFLFILFLSTVSSIFCQEGSFRPEPGKEYVISGWVQESTDSLSTNYNNSTIELNFGTSNVSFSPSGPIIDGWQQITGSFEVPTLATTLEVKLISNVTGGHSYFDDIRIFPISGTMKSFVYDPQTQRLMAELDENNFATFYEYDREGALIRVKKETERGIYTIQESRSSKVKKNEAL